jgi:hypothetical protein
MPSRISWLGYTPDMPDREPPSPEVRAWLRGITSEGGKARAKSLSAARRKEIAKTAARARWKKKRAKKKSPR